MNNRYLHIYHLLPVILFANIAGNDAGFFPIPVPIDSQWQILGTATLVFVCGLLKSGSLQRLCFLLSLSLLVALTLNRLVLHPAIGTLVAALFCIAIVPKGSQPFSYKRLFLTSNYSFLLSFGGSSLLFIALLLDVFRTNSTLFFAAMMSFGSLLYLAGAKLKLNAKISYTAVLTLLSAALILVKIDPLSNHLTAASVGYLISLTMVIVTLALTRKKDDTNSEFRIFTHPEIIIICFFTISASLGALLLQMPASQAQSAPHSLIDSFFTAMSAVCVTGLIVLDTPVDFSFFGQSVILFLIQVGGLGIVSLSAWVLFVFQNKRLSVHHEHTISEMSAYRHSALPRQMISRIISYFLGFETLGALILMYAFIQAGDSFGIAAWRAVFTAISAFCNAGFAIQSDSLIPYQSSSVVMATVSVLIIAGGFAPLLALSLPMKKFRAWNLQEKLSLSTTASLLVLGMTMFLLLEWSYSLSELNVYDKVANAWFQSVTTRTAGFNTVDLTKMRDVTTIFFMILMFIGGNPGSAAGGIKTVTAAVIFYAGLSALRGEKQVTAFNRKMNVEIVFKAIAIAGLGLTAGFFAYLMLAMTQQIETIPLLFETVSALGTVGLSLGITGSLDEVGKIIIIMCMLAGRVGPITFVLSLTRGAPQRKWDVPREDVFVS